MSKNFYALLMAIVICWGNIFVGNAQKSVTYTFTGRNPSLILKINEKPLGLYVSSGTAPKGVSVGAISGVTYDEGKDDEDINDVGIGNTVGLPFIPQYLVMPEEEAIINFQNFAYEINYIRWTSRSQVPLLTSKTSTWVTRWDGTNTETEITKWGEDDAASKQNSSSWQLFYHNKLFTKDTGYSGIKQLHVTCDSKKAFRGHSMKDFIISYYEPELTLTAPDKIELSSSGAFSASITNHPGAFNNAMIQVTANMPDGTTISYEDGQHKGTITTGTTVGSALVTAKLIFEGTTIATVTKKVQIGQFDFDFVQKQLRCDYGTGTLGYGDVSSLHAYWKLYKNRWDDMDEQGGLRLFTEYNYGSTTATPEEKYWWTSDKDYLDYSNSTKGKITNIYNIKEIDNNYFKACLQRIDYNQFVPAYSVVSVPIQFDMVGTRATNLKATSCGFAVAMYNFGQGSEQIWPDKEANATKNTYQYFSLGNIENDDYTGDKNLIGSIGYSTKLGEIGIGYHTKDVEQNVKTEFTFTNTENEAGYIDKKMTQQLGAYSFVKNSSRGNNSSMNSTFGYSNRSKTITYYRYINYDGNGNTGGATETTTGTCVNTTSGYEKATVAVASNGFTKEDANYNYEFVSWNTEANGTGTTYNAGDGINIYNSTDKCGAGPMTLYAQWKRTAKAATRTEINGDDNVYSLWGNGGTIKDEDGNEQNIVAAQFILGAEASSVNKATYNGYTFLGYYDDPEGGHQVFDANGKPVNDGNIITSGRWAAEYDVYLYAHWTRDASVTLKSINITLKANGGALADAETITCTEGSMENNNIATQTPTRTNYKFAGWYTTTDNSGLMVYNANGESVTLASYTIDGEGNITPTYTAYNPTFFDTTGKYVGSATPFNANFTIYAHWIPDGATLTFHEGTSSKAAETEKHAYYQISNNTATLFSNSPLDYEAGEYDQTIITRKLSKTNWNTVCFPFDIYKKQVAALFSDVEMYSGLKITGDDASMKFTKCDIIMAGVPYFVKLNSSLPTTGTAKVTASDDSNVTELTFTGVEASKTPGSISFTDEETETTVTMVGQFNTNSAIPKNSLVLMSNKLYKQGGKYKESDGTYTYNFTNKGFRCYITNETKTSSENEESNENSAKVFNWLSTSIDLDGIIDGIGGDDRTTGIEQVDPDHPTFSIAPKEIYDLSGRKVSNITSKGVYIINGQKYIAR